MSDFVGRGWAFPILPDAGGSLQVRTGSPSRAAALPLIVTVEEP